MFEKEALELVKTPQRPKEILGQQSEFKYETKEEQKIAVACRHLIQNAIILWNYLFISNKLSEIEQKEKIKENIELMKIAL